MNKINHLGIMTQGIIKAELENAELMEMKARCLDFIAENRKLINLSQVSTILTEDGSFDPNFNNMLKGLRRMPENYIRQLHKFLSDTFKHFGDFENSTHAIEPPKGAVMFFKVGEDVSFSGCGLDCRIGPKISEVKLNGQKVSDMTLIMRASGAATAVGKLLTLINS